MNFQNLATEKNRWKALLFLALGLAIVIIDNNVLTVAIPYILRDLHTTFDAIQWVISGYALIIASILITVGRIGDLYGRKRIFVLGTGLFAAGSFIASLAPNAVVLFIGEAFIEGVGAAMMLTSSLALLVTEFQGKERTIAFGIWGSVAGASASIGPLLGGFLTTFYSWRWSLRINVLIAVIAILGSVFVKEAKGEHSRNFDWLGMILSGFGLFFLVFGFIEGRVFGWWRDVIPLNVAGWQWPFSFSVIPFIFFLAFFSLGLFLLVEYRIEKRRGSPLLRLSLFKNPSFSMGLAALGILVMGQFGTFFIFPLYYQNVLGLTAFQTGLIFLWTSIAIAVFGSLSGILATKFGPKWVVVTGMLASFSGIFWMSKLLNTGANGFTFGPALILIGIGIGLASAQVTNIILSQIPLQFSGEASAVNATFRQVGASIGTSLIGSVLAASLSFNIISYVQKDAAFTPQTSQAIVPLIRNVTAESGLQSLKNAIPQKGICITIDNCMGSSYIIKHLATDMDYALIDAAKSALRIGLIFIAIGIVIAVFIPENVKQK